MSYPHTPERSVEEIVEEKKEKFIKKWTQYMVEKTGKCPLEFWDDCDDLLQAERKRCEEVVEAERERILVAAAKIISNPVEFMELTVFTHPNNK